MNSMYYKADFNNNNGSSNSNTSPNGPPPPSNRFAFPSFPSSSRLAAAAASEEQLPPTSATTRFHQALAAYPTSRSNNTRRDISHSNSSSISDTTTFRFPPDSASPTGGRSFDVLQRELVGVGAVESGGGERKYQERVRADSRGATWNQNDEDERRPFGGNGNAQRERNWKGREYGYPEEQQLFASTSSRNEPPNEMDAISLSMGGIGRPASMDMGSGNHGHIGANTSVDEGETSYDFLRSPPSFDPTTLVTSTLASTSNSISRPFGINAGGGGGGGRERVRDRTFPAPLLLKGDRPFGISGRPALGNYTVSSSSLPFTSARKISSSNSAAPSVEHSPSDPFPSMPLPAAPFARPQWSSTNSSPVTILSTLSLDQTPLTVEESRPNPPFRRQHRENSSSNSSTLSSGPFADSPLTATTSALPYSSASPSHPATTKDTMPTTSSSIHEPPISPQDLLLYVLSLRSVLTPMPTLPNVLASSTHQRIESIESGVSDVDDLTSVEGGDEDDTATTVVPTRASSLTTASLAASSGRLDTVDLSHKRIAEVSVDVIEELKDEVEKLALGYNLLRELPMTFAALGGRLRYLNVRVNLLTVFPQVLCEMPSLEILDISRNKIKKLPSQPGTLLNLKVFSIAKNRIKRLPEYFTRMPYLKVLKLDHNPVEWPPKEITGFPLASVTTGHHQRNATGSGSLDGENSGKRSGSSSANKVEDAEEMQRWLPNLINWIKENSEDRRPRPASDDEATSRFAAAISRSDSNDRLDASLALPARRNLPLNPLLTASPSTSTSELYLLPLLDSTPSSPRYTPQLHVRNASHSTTLRPEFRSTLSSKKSLPDLRLSHADIISERRISDEIEESRQRSIDTKKLNVNGRSGVARAVKKEEKSKAKTSTLSPPDLSQDTTRGRTVVDRNAGGFERNSGAYFRRLSMLPASTISKAVYAALRQFVVFASHDRLPAQLSRLLNEADGTMSLLINALDRFDSLSRRGTPDAEIVRDIFVTCKANVVTFGKLVASLGSSLKELVATADVRYTRTLLLMLYGSMGEIANSWNVVSPMVEEMAILNEDYSSASLTVQPPTPSPTLSSSQSSRPGNSGVYRARSRTRRHAGSFSVEDVQLGAVLPPAAVPLPTPSSLPYFDPLHAVPSTSTLTPAAPTSTSKPRTTKSARPTGLALPLTTPLAYRDIIHNAFDSPATPGGGETPLIASASPASVASYPALSASSSRNGDPIRQASVADETFLTMVESTTTVAYDVYATLLNSLKNGGEDYEGNLLMRDLGVRKAKELIDLCGMGHETTKRLRSALGRVKGEPRESGTSLTFSASDAKRLGDEAYSFVQTVIRFAKLVKAISVEGVFFEEEIRVGVGKLTIATRTFANHLSHTVTSFRPAAPASSSLK